jgi:ATP-dependent Lon protease
MFTINFGGMNDVSTLIGHSKTYTGGNYGIIADILIRAKCSDPIIYLDELDKIESGTPQGMELYRVLTHILDEEQNTNFHDNYFSGLSKYTSYTLQQKITNGL